MNAEVSKVAFHWDEEGQERDNDVVDPMMDTMGNTDGKSIRPSMVEVTETNKPRIIRQVTKITSSPPVVPGAVNSGTDSMRFNSQLQRTSSTFSTNPNPPNGDSRTQAAFQIRSQELSLRLQENSLSNKGTQFVNEFHALEQPDKIIADLTTLDKESIETDLHIITLDELIKRFNIDLSRGLNTEIINKNRILYGNNILTPSAEISPFLLFAKQLISGFSFLLWVATIVIFLSWYPLGQLNNLIPQTVNVAVAALLLVVIFISAIFNFWMELRAINIIRSFSSIVPAQAHVRRNGNDIQISASELVVGDLVTISLGEKVPADIRLISVSNFQVNNSALTGESEPITSTTQYTNLNYMESLNLCFYGTLVPQGSAIGIVIATGDQTVMGQINELTQTNFNTETSLHKEMLHFVGVVATAALITGIVILIIWLSYLRPNYPTFMPPAGFVLNLISLIVAYVPEGLPICVTVTLTLIAKRMYLQHVLVRNLAIVETFNSISLIASDKTGTLTMNQMCVTNLIYGLKKQWLIPSTATNNTLTASRRQSITNAENKVWNSISNINTEPFRMMILGAALCNSAKIQQETNNNNPNATTPLLSILGDAADTALYHLLQQQLYINPEIIRNECPKIKILPFNSTNKFMAVWCNITNSTLLSKYHHNHKYTEMIFIKGAPEMIINKCNAAIVEKNDENGDVIPQPMTNKLKIDLLNRQEELGKKGLRVIGICCQAVERNSNSNSNSNNDSTTMVTSINGTNDQNDEKDDSMDGFPVNGYCFLGMFGLLDPPRPGVSDAVLKAHQAGIRVAMVTGDHSTTAAAIARQVNIIPPTIDSDDVYHLRIGADGIGRAVFEILQGEKQIFTHVIGSKKKTDQKPNNDNNNNNNNNKPVKGTIIIDDNINDIDEEDNELMKSPLAAPKLKRTWLQKLLGRNKPPIEPRPPTINAAAIITGTDLKLFDDYMWKWALEHHYLVFCRTSPEQKLKIVKEAQDRHEVVAVTGDGVNDAPALKQSDLGIAMQAGADVAREAGDLVLLDNNFSSIIDGIETGRVVSDNLRKVCLYLMVGGTYCEMWAVMANVVFGLPLPLSSFQMLFVSIACDIFNALALVQEQPEEAIMLRNPVDRRLTSLVDRKVVFQAYGLYGTICTFSAMLCYFWYMQEVGGLHANCLFFAYTYQSSDPYTCQYDSSVSISAADQNELVYTAQSIYFVSLLVTNWFQMLATRTRYSSILTHNPFWGRGQNLYLIVAMVAGIAVAVFILNVSWFNLIFFTRPVPIKHICPALGFGALVLVLDELRKWWVRKNPDGWWARIAW